MGHVYAVLGAGRQGTAAAHALATTFAASEVRLIDADRAAAEAALARIERLEPSGAGSRARLRALTADGRDPAALDAALAGAEAVLSALPYPLNPGAAAAAIAAGAHFTDLGGNTDVVEQELLLGPRAAAAGVSLVPDIGLAPGLNNALAALALLRLPAARSVRMWCGGLPQQPRGLLGYKLLFHIGGLTNEYTGEAICLRKGERVALPAFTEREEVDLPPPVGRAEAFLTSGGTSTGPWTWEGRLDTLEYKTVRWPGHHAMVWPLVALGFLDPQPVRLGHTEVIPRELAHALLLPHIDHPGPDLVVLRVEASAPGGQRLVFDLLDRQDERTGFTAMERSTAFPAAALARLQAEGGVAPGAHPVERAFDPERYFALVQATGLAIAVTAG